MKKIIVWTLMGVMALCLAACSKDANEKATDYSVKANWCKIPLV